jgi:hypothetical protein
MKQRGQQSGTATPRSARPATKRFVVRHGKVSQFDAPAQAAPELAEGPAAYRFIGQGYVAYPPAAISPKSEFVPLPTGARNKSDGQRRLWTAWRDAEAEAPATADSFNSNFNPAAGYTARRYFALRVSA